MDLKRLYALDFTVLLDYLARPNLLLRARQTSIEALFVTKVR
jgi:hypothetical protein